MPRDIPIKFKWSEQYLLTKDTEWQRRQCVLISPFHWGMALHVSCCWVSNTSVEPGEQELLGPGWECPALHGWPWGQARLRAMEKEMGLEWKRLLLIMRMGNIVRFSSVHSQNMRLFSVLGNFCENLLMVYKLAERRGVFFGFVFCLLFCFFPFNAWMSLDVISLSVLLFFFYMLKPVADCCTLEVCQNRFISVSPRLFNYSKTFRYLLLQHAAKAIFFRFVN